MAIVCSSSKIGRATTKVLDKENKQTIILLYSKRLDSIGIAD